MVGYCESIEHKMVNLYASLNEKDRRRYAAVEAEKLGHGGTEYIARLFACDPKTIRRGTREVESLPEDPAEDRIRKKGEAAKLLANASPASSSISAKKLKPRRRARR
ncbi:hypothetical protein [Rhodopirellula bahusiensis]|uniref:hypothetical protein n=2 Tax=Rhodopirellula bahusiensis TaxID=2014065 RepID=UPI0032977C28